MAELPREKRHGNVGAIPNAPRLPDAIQMQMPSDETDATITPQAVASPQRLPHRKVAIPRGRSVAAHAHRRRVPRACESCRIRKTKCSGDAPVCRQCHELRATCVYPPPIREKMLRQQADLLKKLQTCQNLLQEAEPFVPGRTAKKIKECLQDSDSGYGSNDIPSASPVRGEVSKDEVGQRGSSSSSSVGSLDALDQVQYDINRTDQSRAAGNFGKSSEITWLQKLKQQAEQPRRAIGQFDFDNGHEDNSPSSQPLPHEMNYHLDDLEIGVSEPVQTYWLPPRPLADNLFNTYLRVAHPYLPIINRPLFCDQYRNFFDSFAVPGDKWLAILNMMFAIAATYAQTTGLKQHGDPQDHLLYLTRARILSMSGDDVFRHADLQQVQVEGLISFYLLSTDQIHRAWRISALAIRSAVSLGLNLKTSGHAVTSLSKETRNRVWWSLFIIENKIGLMTGRPTCVSVNMCSSPFPLPLGDEQLQTSPATLLLNDPAFRDKRINNVMASSHLRQASFGRSTDESDIFESHEWLSSLPATAELCFLYGCDLTNLMQELLDHIYTVNSVHQTWQHIKTRIDELQSRVDVWFTGLPRSLNFTYMMDDDEAKDEKTRLACQYYSARILLGRPCLCKSEKSQSISEEEQSFTHTMAISTVRSASRMAQLIPDVSGDGQLFGISPWWCCLHYVVQTVTVLILELSLNCFHMAGEKDSVLQLAKRCVRWLGRRSEHSLASHRAWQLCDSSLRRLALPMGFDVSDLPSSSSRQSQNSEADVLNTLAFRAHPELFDHVPMPDYSMYHPFQTPDQPQSTPFTDASVDAGVDDPFYSSDPITKEFIESFFVGSGNNDNGRQAG
ncbi:uncharacterized protein N7459_001348 [Penicillium hispanicum]|uniref:uncharacterized protein n=1 Tax=Penicillium hispanicum TaxID=1080232 RepID=UPI002541FA9B|nr:uncharacterized protein N7459_001348 [Penicillium hispanicum]KAJ5595140.1 hypothetical protein N7459_001348 [Penicillium hispanicum]